LTLRVVASGRHAVRVTTRGVQLSIGRPVEFDSEATDVSALECALAAIGAEVVGGLRTFAERRRLVLDDVEAVVKARLEAPLVYVGVIGERGNPRLSIVAVKVYVSSPEEAHLIERAFVLMHLCGVACYAAVPERTSDFLAPAARGRHSSTLAFSERGSRSHFWAPVSRAVRNDGQVSLSAEKSFVTSAGHADGYVVSTLDAEESTPVASTIYLVLANDPGVSASTPWDGLGLRGNSSGPLSLKDVTIPTERALTEHGKRLDMMLGIVLPLFQVGSAAVALGLAEAAVRKTTVHLTQAKARTPGHRPRGSAGPAHPPCPDAHRDRSGPRAPGGRARLARVARTDDATAGARSEGRRHRGGCRRHRSRDARVRRGRARARARPGTPVSRRTRTDCHVPEHRSGARLHRPGAVRHGGVLMARPLVIGAVMYDPKVSVIWEIIRDFFEQQAYCGRRKSGFATPFHYLFQVIDPLPHCLYRPTVIRSPREEASIMRSAFRWSAVAAFAAAIVFGAPAHAFAQG
jgi:hypothetical protein